MANGIGIQTAIYKSPSPFNSLRPWEFVHPTKIINNEREIKMGSLKNLMFIVLLTTLATPQIVKIPDTNAGRLLRSFLDVVETGNVEDFINNKFGERILKTIPVEKHIRFLKMIHKMHGGFVVYKIIESEENKIEVVCKSNKNRGWRRVLIGTNDDSPNKILFIDITQTTPPEEYFSTLPKIKIERPKNDDSIIKGKLGKKIDSYMRKIESIGFSGALIVAKNDTIILARGYGYADRENKKIFSRKTVFTIGSITKQFTGAAIVKLHSMGKISFNDPITKYFKNVPDDKKKITIHELLTHTAGFSEAIGDDYEKISRDDFIKRAMSSKLKYEPGKQYSYSNVGYSLLGAIIEIVTGESYESFLRENLFLPAGMKNTGYVIPDWNEDDIVIGYMGSRKWGRPTNLLWGKDGPGWNLKCNGGILSTIDDMCKWGRAILGPHLFTEEEKKNYLTPYVPEGPGAKSYYSYGWVRMKLDSKIDVITHNGGNPYIQNDMYIFPDKKVIMFITSNNGEFSALDQSEKILKMIFKQQK